jgi:hypothetical protein
MATPDMSRTKARPEWVRLALLAANAWIVASLIPMLLSTPPTALVSVIVVIPVIPAIGGLAMLGRNAKLSRLCLLLVFPAGIALVAALLPGLGADNPFPPIRLALLVLSVSAFIAFAGSTLGERDESWEVTVSPVPVGDGQRKAINRRPRQAALIAITAVASFLMSVVVPVMGTRQESVQHWGDAADAALTLTAVVGGMLSVAILAVIIAPGLRTEMIRRRTRRQMHVRVIAYLFVTFLGGVLLVLMHRSG